MTVQLSQRANIMSDFPIHTRDSASSDVHDIFDGYQDKLGFVPNLVGILAESPAALRTYATGYAQLGNSSFTPAEQQLLFLSVSRANQCTYCVAAHSMAGKMAGLDDDVIEDVRNGRPVLDPKLAAIAEFATKMVEKRGFVSAQDIETFQTAGHTRAQVLDVVLAVATKTISNYMNHIADTPLDDAFASTAWQPAAQHEAAQ